MGFYETTLVACFALNAGFAYWMWKKKRAQQLEVGEAKNFTASDRAGQLSLFKRKFLPVYLLVNGADWLQGPYIYPVYKDTKKLAEDTIAFLFIAGFVSATVSATFTGVLADKYGRRKGCLALCIIYSFSCASLLSDNMNILILGRCLGGCSATLLYTVVESWMVSEYRKVLPDENPEVLNNLFGTMTTLNSLIAILAGVLAEFTFSLFNSQLAPFGASVVCLAIAFFLILTTWSENYGDSADGANTQKEGLLEQQKAPTKSFLQIIRQDRRIPILSAISAVFEGSMFVFIFLKFAALRYSHQFAVTSGLELPYGTIFAILMCSMMAGATLYKYLIDSAVLLKPAQLLMWTMCIAALCFCVPVVVRDEAITFWCFCLFEVCCGIYFPLMASQRGSLIDDAVRARFYAWLRIPLNLFVVTALATTKEGVEHRDLVFLVCSGLLLAVGTLSAAF